MYTTFVYTSSVKNVTFSADERTVERARAKARSERKTLNTAFREWLERYAGSSGAAEEFDHLMRRLSRVKFPRKFTRDEMNAR